MYWRDQPVVGVDEAKLPQFTIVGYQTNERKIKLATGKIGLIVSRDHVLTDSLSVQERTRGCR